MADVHWQMGCQFGQHGDPFLWYGSGNDGVDIAIMQLINLARENPRMAHEAAEFIDACVKDAAQQMRAADTLPLCEISRECYFGQDGCCLRGGECR